jgi:hypothetical protein
MKSAREYRNERLDYWHEYLKGTHAAEVNFCFLDISLWEIFIGLFAVIDLFKADSDKQAENLNSRPSLIPTLKSIINIGKILVQFILAGKSKGFKTSGILFMSFEKRQVSCFVESIKLLRQASVPLEILTTTISAAQEWPDEISSNQVDILYLESMIGIHDCFEVFSNYFRIMKWLASIKSACIHLERRSEMLLLLELVKKKLLYVLFLIKFSQQLFKLYQPRKLIGADISDMRARACFLMAKKLNVISYHTPYGFYTPECYEEKYLVADRKLVFSESHKQQLMNQFGLPETAIGVIGCPRFDPLFQLRNSKILKKISEKVVTILIGSQPLGNEQDSSFGKSYKTNTLRQFFSFINNRNTRVLLKPHPDETYVDIDEILAIGRENSITIEVLEDLDFSKCVQEIDVFVTFFSTLSLEMIILGIPVCYLTCVQDMPILDAAVKNGLAKEIFSSNEWAVFINYLDEGSELFSVKSDEFLIKEFTNIDGTASSNLVNLLNKTTT